MTTWPHMCRDGHDEIGWRGDDERCPVCREREAALDKARKELAWPRCDECGGEMQEWHSEEPLRCPLCHVEGKLTLMRDERDSLRLELDSAQSMRLKDNAYLIGERDEAQAEVFRLRDVLEQRASELEAVIAAATQKAERERDDARAQLAEAEQQVEVLGPGGRYNWKQRAEQAEATLAAERDVTAQLRKDVEALAAADVELRRTIIDLRSIANVNGDWTVKVSELVAALNTASALLAEAQAERDGAMEILRGAHPSLATGNWKLPALARDFVSEYAALEAERDQWRKRCAASDTERVKLFAQRDTELLRECRDEFTRLGRGFPDLLARLDAALGEEVRGE